MCRSAWTVLLASLLLLAKMGLPTPGATNDYALSAEWTLGGGDGTCFDAPLDRVRDVVEAPDGTVYVSDGGNNRILRVSAEGACLEAIGQPGEGPGEFVALGALDLHDGRLYALDAKRRRISVFGPGHAFERHIPIDQMVADFQVRDEGLVISAFNLRGKEALWYAYGFDGQSRGAFGEPLPSTTAVDRAGMSGKVVAHEGQVIYAYAYPYQIEVFDRQGEAVRRVSVEDATFKPPAEGSDAGGVIYGGSLETAVRAVTTSGPGGLLVQVQSPTENRVDVFSESLERTASIPLPAGHLLTKAGTEAAIYTIVHGGADAFASVTKWSVQPR